MSVKTTRPRFVPRTVTTGGRRPAALATAAAVAMLAVSAIGAPSAAADPVPLGRATSFALLAGSGISNTGATTITGDMGSSPTPADPLVGVTLNGADHGDDAVTQGAQIDNRAAYTEAFNRPTTATIPVELGGSTLRPGVYDTLAGTFGLTGALTLDGMNDPNSVFVFKMASELTTAAASSVLMINGANPCQVVWQVGSSATFGANTDFVGDVLVDTSITAGLGASFDGRLLAFDGFVTLHNNTITNAACVEGVDEEEDEDDDGDVVVIDDGDGDGDVDDDDVPATPTPVTASPTTPSATTQAPTSTTAATPTATTPPAGLTGRGTGTAIETGAPARPGRPTAGSPAAPGAPGVPSLPRTGSAVGGLTAAGVTLVVVGVITAAAGRRRRAAD